MTELPADTVSTTSHKIGMSPGALVHVGDYLEETSRITVIDYSRESLVEQSIEDLAELDAFDAKDTVTWVLVEGLSNIEFIEALGCKYGIHPLVLEDILNTHQRPKFEEYDDYLFTVVKCPTPKQQHVEVSYEQISIIVLKNFVFTFKEREDDRLDPLISRIRNSKGRFRKQGADYLAYAILDTVVDYNFVVIDYIDEEITAVEDELLDDPSRDTMLKIQKLKREIIAIRRNTSPVRDVLSGFIRTDSELVNEKTLIYFRDVFDHILRIVESVESYRDILSGLLDIYISSVSNKMNEVMKVLTVFASIFIPLTFIAGIYGMNFQYMPELKWKWSYPLVWILFLLVPIILLVYFRKKKWL
jgi:magnesium transporter